MNGGRIAVVAGKRTPHAKAFGRLAHLSAVDLGVHASKAALQAAGLKAVDVDEMVFGNVAGPPDASNVSRVISLRTGMRNSSLAHTVNRNCGSGMESVIAACQALNEKRSSVVVAGGTESMSNVPFLARDSLKQKLLRAGRSKSMWGKIKSMSAIRRKDLVPVPGLELGLTDPVCQLNMGETAEVLASTFAIPREHQDAYAVASHQKACAAAERCFMSGEVAPLTLNDGEELTQDVGPRKQQSLEQLAKLRPLFDVNGSVTAGNSCPITDGATALVLKRENEADANVLGYISHYAIAGCDPSRMGLGPVYAMRKLFDQTGLSMRDFDLLEINEAFAVQVIACCQVAESRAFAQQEFGSVEVLGAIDPMRLNIHGGAIALGHPVGASGTRLILTLLRALKERGEFRGLAALCVGGGQGMAMVVEAA